MTSHNVTLPDELSAHLLSQVKSGKYASVSEVVRSYIRIGQELEEERVMKKKRLEKLLDEADKDIENGKYTKLNNPEEVSLFISQIGERVLKRANA